MVLSKQHLPILWVFPGMSSEWLQMGKSLLEVPVFRETILKCQNVLNNVDENIDLMNVLTTNDPEIFKNPINAFIGICAMEIGFINILRKLQVEPDFILGISLGDVAAGYADHCFTEEEAILFAYYRGLVTKEGDVKGLMVAIWMNTEDLKSILPESIEIGCFISSNVNTIVGSEEEMTKFLESLDKNIKYKVTSKIPFHSKHIKHLGPELQKQLQKVNMEQKKMSRKWISSSFVYKSLESKESKLCGPEFFVDNFTRPIYFEQACKLLPSEFILLDLSPSGLLKRFAKNNFPKCAVIALADDGNLDGVELLLTQLKE